MPDTTANPAKILTETIDQSRYELVQEIRRMGSKVQQGISDFEEIAAIASRALEDGTHPMGFSSVIENPVQVLRDMDGLIRTALLLGVPQACIMKARRGGFVSTQDYLTPTR